MQDRFGNRKVIEDALPTTPGFYYGRPRFKHESDSAIEPRAVRLAGDGSTGDLYVQEQYSNHNVSFYDWFALGFTKLGQPRHPLYLPNTAVPIPMDRSRP